MPNVSQFIPTYLGGISQEPDANKAPGTLVDCINGYPDITYGLRKRPGLKYEFYLDDTANLTNGRWFAIAKPGSFPFFGVILPNDKIRIWNAATRAELTTTDNFNYLKINDKAPIPLSRDSYKVTSIENVTVVLNTHAKTQASSDVVAGTITGTVTTFSDLAELTPTDGDIYEILNTPERNEDNYYVEYNSGSWKEVAKPGISVGVDSSTMPHVLQINPGGTTFSFVEADNIDRAAGDDTTNPMPSFVGTFINSVFFYLNRVGYLAKDNIFLSQPLIPDNINTNVIQRPNYFNSSAIAQSAADPVDVNCGTIRPVQLINALPAYNGLALFSQNEQYVLYSDQGVITPQTALVKSISNYEMNELIDAVEVGENFVFVSKTQRNTRVWELQMQGLERDPLLTDIGKIITDYIPNNIDTLVSNPQNQFISLSSTKDNKMYILRRHTEQGELRLRAWFRWDLPGNIQSCAFFSDRMFIVSEVGGKTIIGSAALNLVPEEDILTNLPFPDGSTPGSGEGIGPFLDQWISDATPQKITITYDTVNTYRGDTYVENLKFTFPAGYPSSVSGLEPCVVKSKDPLTFFSNVGTSVEKVGLSPTVKINDDGTWSIKGRFKPSQVTGWVAGWRFNYDMYIPTTYFRNGDIYDTQSYLKIDRYKFLFNEVSEVTFKVQQNGGLNTPFETNTTWNDIVPSIPANLYVENTFPYLKEFTFQLPIHQRNTFFRCRVFDNSPFPCTLSSMMWEGVYNPRYYRRS